MIFDLALVKKQLIVDHSEEDEYIQSLCIAAEQAFNNYCSRTLFATDADLSGAPENAVLLTESIQLGAMVLVGSWYENREGGRKLPMPTRLLWDPYRWLNV
ncbi:head-tail connector protein [Microbulbifer sp. THAF38]|uniref:head-tail connector protein n=1 Tax=Microbulbifer sp. THAF38 TaxID=2587856 RepID=UPI0012A7FE89|nr:head-tail connector protein [Microbulbifer sp. THAF38]QFT53539.1 Phage gp6-like head-tail connector protein [Microbulbifer sp. THAF38]